MKNRHPSESQIVTPAICKPGPSRLDSGFRRNDEKVVWVTTIVEGVLGFAACALLARAVCPRGDFFAALSGLALAWFAASVGIAVLAVYQDASFGTLFGAFWGGLGLRALAFLALAVFCFLRPEFVAALIAYAVGTAVALVFLESRWIMRQRRFA